MTIHQNCIQGRACDCADLVKRLRDHVPYYEIEGEAADEIERLQSELTQSAEREATLLGKVECLERELADALDSLDKNWVQHQRVVKAEKELTEAQQLAAERLVQMEQYKVDALRYRWLRADNAYFPEEKMIMGGVELDAAIDAAMKETPHDE